MSSPNLVPQSGQECHRQQRHDVLPVELTLGGCPHGHGGASDARLHRPHGHRAAEMSVQSLRGEQADGRGSARVGGERAEPRLVLGSRPRLGVLADVSFDCRSGAAIVVPALPKEADRIGRGETVQCCARCLGRMLAADADDSCAAHAKAHVRLTTAQENVAKSDIRQDVSDVCCIIRGCDDLPCAVCVKFGAWEQMFTLTSPSKLLCLVQLFRVLQNKETHVTYRGHGRVNFWQGHHPSSAHRQRGLRNNKWL